MGKGKKFSRDRQPGITHAYQIDQRAQMSTREAAELSHHHGEFSHSHNAREIIVEAAERKSARESGGETPFAAVQKKLEYELQRRSNRDSEKVRRIVYNSYPVNHTPSERGTYQVVQPKISKGVSEPAKIVYLNQNKNLLSLPLKPAKQPQGIHNDGMNARERRHIARSSARLTEEPVEWDDLVKAKPSASWAQAAIANARHKPRTNQRLL